MTHVSKVPVEKIISMAESFAVGKNMGCHEMVDPVNWPSKPRKEPCR